MDEMCYIVATKHSGSLKGEHGTGRNVAPYVEMEWGEAQATPQHVAWYPACLHVPGLAWPAALTLTVFLCRHQGVRADVGAQGDV